MPKLSEFAAALVRQLHLRELSVSAERALLMIAALFLLIALFERLSGGTSAKYFSRSFRSDLLYSLFYAGGFYQFWISAVVLGVISPHLKFLDLGLFSRLPIYLSYPLFWVFADFLGYWIHRLQHKSRVLWALHSIHHAPRQLTFLTSYRNHVFEQLIVNIVMSVPILILGVPPVHWMPLYVLQMVQESMQHAELPWSFGPLYSWFVSPRFHQFHHSVAVEHHDRNFGKILSCWDVIFGTSVPAGPVPVAYGLGSTEIPESLLAQFLYPFRSVGNWMKPSLQSVASPKKSLTSLDDSAINPVTSSAQNSKG